MINLFMEITDFIFGKNHEKVIYLPFIMNDYNYHAFTASD
jgi:hypothetical protein